jgi:demethylmenaquinone methyltransferase / 2-methoxy-6-polyprenyl-1,4-benzoquinol methylase
MKKSKENIKNMFDEIADSYDFLNHLFTLNIDMRWRKQIIKELKKDYYKKDIILDIASGTGDLTKELVNLKPEHLYSCDISEKMLEVQKKKIKYDKLKIVVADSSNLPYKEKSVDIVTIGFGIRNFENVEKSFAEIYRILKPGGHLIILEMFGGKGFKKSLFDIYFGKIIPKVGNKISKSKYAYNYLFKSVKNFYNTDEFINLAEYHNFRLEKKVNNFSNFIYTIYFAKN